MVGARVNGRQVPIEYKLQTGDRVEIITSQNSKGPSRDWLSIVKSSQARSKINQWFKAQYKEENIQKGKELIDRYAKSRGLTLSDYMKPDYQKKCMTKYGLKNWEAVLAAVGHGGLKEGQVVNRLVEEYEKEHKKQLTDQQAAAAVEEKNKTASRPQKIHSKSGITVKGADDVSVRFSKCCSPVPGDEIIGFVTRGRGVSIHRTDCTNIVSMPEEDRRRLIDAEWEENAAEKTGELYLAEISIYAHNRTGILVDISKIFLELKVDIISIQTRTSKQGLKTLELSFETSGIEELNHIIQKIRNVESVIDIERTTG
jgi:GTP pyrophosphokinase